MVKYKVYFSIIGFVMFIPTLACGSVGIYDPEATQVAMAGTVTALQATIAALESNLNQNQSDSAEVQVVTATPTPTSVPPAESDTIIPASSLEQTIQLTSTPTRTPITISSQDRVVTLVATFTPTPTPEQHPYAPIISAPRAGTVVEEEREILLQWSWNGILKYDEYFDIKIKPDGQHRSAYVAWERGEAHNLQANLTPGRYYWTVQVLKGYYRYNSGEPEDRIFQAFTSPESEARLIIVAAKEDDPTPTPTPTSDPNLGNNNENSQNSSSSETSSEVQPEVTSSPPDEEPTDNTQEEGQGD
jgi:hypothetical protein